MKDDCKDEYYLNIINDIISYYTFSSNGKNNIINTGTNINSRMEKTNS